MHGSGHVRGRKRSTLAVPLTHSTDLPAKQTATQPTNTNTSWPPKGGWLAQVRHKTGNETKGNGQMATLLKGTGAHKEVGRWPQSRWRWPSESLSFYSTTDAFDGFGESA